MKKANNKKQIDAEINRVLLSDFDKIEHFVISRWKQMFIGAGVIIVLVAIAYGVMLKKENNDRAAQRAVADAATKEQLTEVIKRYNSYKEADFARIRLAVIYANEKDFAKASELYKTVAQNTQAEDLKCRMLLDSAYMLEKSGAFADACKAFMSIGDNTMYGAGVRAEAYYSALRLYLKDNKKNEAAAVLGKLKSFAKDSDAATWLTFAETLIVK